MYGTGTARTAAPLYSMCAWPTVSSPPPHTHQWDTHLPSVDPLANCSDAICSTYTPSLCFGRLVGAGLLCQMWSLTDCAIDIDCALWNEPSAKGLGNSKGHGFCGAGSVRLWPDRSEWTSPALIDKMVSYPITVLVFSIRRSFQVYIPLLFHCGYHSSDIELSTGCKSGATICPGSISWSLPPCYRLIVSSLHLSFQIFILVYDSFYPVEVSTLACIVWLFVLNCCGETAIVRPSCTRTSSFFVSMYNAAGPSLITQ